MVRPGTLRMIYLAAAAALFALSTAWVRPLHRQRVENHLVAAEIARAADPELMFGPLLAVGRAPLVDYLWLRATKMKDEGRFFDAFQLAETICSLQPRFGAVWQFNAWNMAYNISVTLRAPEDRWRWVRNGFELLRDHGIPLNPRNTVLYKELAWIFFHKVGDFLDEHHWYYKNQLALIVEDVLGPGAEHDWAGLAAAPADWANLTADPAVAAARDALRAAGRDVSQPGVMLGLRARRDVPPAVDAVLKDARHRDAVRRIELFWRAKRLRDELKIDPGRIIELREAYGPFDIRLPEAHALYWASLGTEIGTDKRVALDIDRIGADRIEFYCLQNFFRRGKLVLSPQARQGEPPLLLPDLRFADRFRKAVIAVSKNYQRRDGDDEKVHENFESALINFMREASLRFNEANQIAKSREYFDWLVEHYPDPMYDKGYEPFIKKMWSEDQKYSQFRSAQSRIYNLIARGLQLIAYGDAESGKLYVDYARRVWGDYMKERVQNRENISFEDTFENAVKNTLGELKPYLRPESYERLLNAVGPAGAKLAPPEDAPPVPGGPAPAAAVPADKRP